MKKFNMRYALILLPFLIVTIHTNSHAQTGIVSGKVLDTSSGEPLGGAVVMIENTNRGVVTDFESGEYLLRRVPVGQQTIVVRFMGYVTETFTVEINENETTTLNVELSPDVVEGEEITVSGQALGQAEAIQRQLNASTIVNVVSQEKIRGLADANAAESVGRLPGVGVVRNAGEGSQVSIRGLAPQYNAINIEGVRIAGTDNETRAVDLNMISQEMLTGIEVFKSNRPDMDADAIGGTVNFSLASAPEGRRFRLRLEGGYNNHVKEAENFGASFSGSDRFLDSKLGVFLSLDFERNDRSSDVLGSDFRVFRDARDDEEFAPLEIERGRFLDREEERDRIGGNLILDYQLSEGHEITISNFANRLDREEFSLNREMDVIEFRQRWIARDRDVQVDILSNRVRGEHQFFKGAAFLEWKMSRSVSTRDIPFDQRLIFEENAAFDDSEIDARMGMSGILPGAKNNFGNAFLWRTDLRGNDLREREYNGQFDVTLPFQRGSLLSGEIKFGGKHVDKNRSREFSINELNWIDGGEMDDLFDGLAEAGFFGGDDVIFTGTGQFSMLNFADLDFRNDAFLNRQFSSFNPFPLGIIRNAPRFIGENFGSNEDIFIPRARGILDNNGAVERITSAYFMTEVNIGNRLLIFPGFRFEHTDGEYQALIAQFVDPRNPVDDIMPEDTVGTNEFGQFFPMIQVRYNVTDWLDVRFAFTQSTSRPSFNQLVPALNINSNARTVRRGRPEIVPLKSTNWDLFFTFHSNKIGLFTVGGFRKNIDDLIFEREIVTLDPVSVGLPANTRFFTVTEPANNEEETRVRGLEFEWQSNLTHLPKPFNGLVLNANVSRIWSDTRFPISELRRTSEGLVRVDSVRKGPMPFQPNIIVNIATGYEIKGFSARVSYNFQGETLTLVGARRETDRFSENFTSWDIAVQQRITDQISVFANFFNITNEPETAEQFTGEFVTDEEFFNWTADLGVRFNFR